ncbi:hypothetical protein DQ354_11865 [Arthrobacter sp. AQ5-06]|nr:hypothetical protein DQ354_11865 [Arthrobacter sp. AQ5-06]
MRVCGKLPNKRLDEAVTACYAWPKSMAQDRADIVRRLTQLLHIRTVIPAATINPGLGLAAS